VEWILLLYELAIVVVPVYGVVWLRRRLKRGAIKRLRAFGYYAGLVLAPVVVYTLLFLALVGIERAFGVPLITDELARALASILGLGLAMWLIASVAFGCSLALSKNDAAVPGAKAKSV